MIEEADVLGRAIKLRFICKIVEKNGKYVIEIPERFRSFVREHLDLDEEVVVTVIQLKKG